MATVGNIKAELLLKFEGMEDTYSVGHLEIPVNVTTDEKRPGQLNLRADTSGAPRTMREAMEEVAAKVDALQRSGVLRSNTTRNTKEN